MSKVEGYTDGTPLEDATYVEKLSDVLKVGDEFTTDKGKKMRVTGIGADGEIEAEFC